MKKHVSVSRQFHLDTTDISLDRAVKDAFRKTEKNVLAVMPTATNHWIAWPFDDLEGARLFIGASKAKWRLFEFDEELFFKELKP